MPTGVNQSDRITPKTGVAVPAVAGGEPMFRQTIHVGRPNIGDRQRLRERIDDLLFRRWLTSNGQYVQEFERRVALRIGVRHVVAVCNGTVALEIAVRALGLTGEVIVPSFTFAATVHALHWLGVTPVFCDVHPRTHALDPDASRNSSHRARRGSLLSISGVARARSTIFPPSRIDTTSSSCSTPLTRLAARNKGRMVGNFGNAEVLSFHATKVLNTFEGGAVVTNDDDLADRLRLMRNMGFRSSRRSRECRNEWQDE